MKAQKLNRIKPGIFTEGNGENEDENVGAFMDAVCRRTVIGGLGALVAGESVRLRQGYGGQGAEATALQTLRDFTRDPL